MKRKLLALAVATALLAIAIPATAGAAISSVFSTVTCTEQTGANAGQRWCGSSANTTVPSFDGTPIDVSVAFPPATGEDKNYPVIGLYHGWGSTKITPSSGTAQRFLKLGYAVFSITDRGWGSSCGGPSKPANTVKAAPCEHGYIHLLSRRYEVRDAQTLLGKLADEGVINPQEIGANGGSYGGGMSLELGSLKDRVELPNGELIPWESPGGKAMKIAATAPEYPWSDIAEALEPNGSTLDYVENSPYQGMLGNHEFGIEKNNWNATLYGAGQLLGYYGPAGDPEANITEWHNFNITGGPYNGKPLAVQQEEQLPNHSAYYTNLEEAPSPTIMENGWNDDLFPVDETVKYYNKVRAAYPNAAMKIFDLDLGHNPRSASPVSTADVGKLQAAQNEWFSYYVRGEGSEPAGAHGSATAITSFCPQTAGGSGTEYKAANWAALDKGELDLSGAAEQTIVAPGTASANAFTSGTVCTTQSSGTNASAATYNSAPAAEAFSLVGSSTVIAELSTPGENAQVIARLYDVNGATEQLIGRSIYRPISPGAGFVKQVFQLHPQAWKVEPGHSLRLELLAQDSAYARNSSTPQSTQVKNLELRVPTVEGPGGDGGAITAPQAPYLPPGYTLARNELTSAPGQPHLTSGSTPNNNGQFTLAWNASEAATALTYTLEHKNASGGWEVVASGLTGTEYAFTSPNPEGEGTWLYRVSASNEGPSSTSEESAPVVVDETAPNPPSANADRLPDYAGGGGWYKDTVTVSFSANGDPALSDGSPGSGVDPSSVPSPQTFSTDGAHEASGTVKDNAGNTSAPGGLTVQVDASPPNVEVSCPATAIYGSSAKATVTASDGQSGLAVDPSGTVPIDTTTVGVKTTSATAEDNVGHSAEASCSTTVKYSSIITGATKGKLTINSGEGVEIAPGAKVSGAVKVKSGGAVDVEGATLSGGLATSKATVVRVCGASISGASKLVGTSGPVVLGQPGSECDASSFFGNVTVKSGTGGVTIEGSALVEENMFHGNLMVSSNSGGVTVRNNSVAGSLTVKGNSGTVIDTPNAVEGKSKLQ